MELSETAQGARGYHFRKTAEHVSAYVRDRYGLITDVVRRDDGQHVVMVDCDGYFITDREQSNGFTKAQGAPKGVREDDKG